LKIDQKLVNELFNYNDGRLYWRANIGGKKLAGKQAGSVMADGYYRVGINRKAYKLHRIIYLWHYGDLPPEIDHIDGNRANNRIENLRPADTHVNKYNAGKRVNNTSGCKNVSWDKNNRKWVVRFRINGEKHYFGSFTDLDLADLVAVEARNKYHKAFANHG